MALGDNVIHPLWMCDTRDAVEPCEPRPRAVPEVGSPENVDSRGLQGAAVDTAWGAQDVLLPDWVLRHASDVFFAEAAKFDTWLRGFDYELLGEGHYEDD